MAEGDPARERWGWTDRDSGVSPLPVTTVIFYRGSMTTATDPSLAVGESTPATSALPTPTAADSQTLGILALVSALSGILFGLVVPLSIVAVVLGILALQREPRSRTLATWSIVLGAVPFAFGLFAIAVGAAVAIPFGVWALLGGF